MNKINKQSLDLQQEKLKALQSAMPQLFNEDGVLDIKELELLSKGYPSLATGKYEFNWAGKISAKRNAYKPSRANLKPDKERSIDFDNTENMIIEGDNLEVLKLFQMPYSGKIKCVYIDPPYNTGNDFVYSDDFSEDKKAYWEKSGTTENGVKIDTNTEAQGRYHSNWLNMIYPRLVLARELLKDDGIIFVSIDDNEVHNLRKIMDEIFGEENFVSTLIWEKKTGASDAKTIATITEYVIVYTKNNSETENTFNRNIQSFDLNRYKYKDEYFKERGPYYIDNLDRGGLRYSDSLNYEIETPDGKKTFPNGRKVFRNDGWIWKWGKKKFDWGIKNGFIVFKESEIKESGVGVYYKNYLNVDNEGNPIQRSAPKKNLIKGVLNANGTRDIQEIFEGKVFDYPKPKDYIREIINFTICKNEIILDFFAGSGTTAHAVMDLNKEDGGNRKYILVQLPELTDEKSEAYKAGYKTISDICIERVKRVSEKIKKEDEEKLLKEGKNLDLGFKVFKLAPSFFPENQFTPDPEKSEDENMKAFEDYLEKAKSQMKFEFEEEELIYEIALKDGFKLTFNKELIEEISENKVYKISDGEKEALVCLDNTISNSTLKILEGMKDMRFICLERAVDTTKKWNLKSIFGQNLWVA